MSGARPEFVGRWGGCRPPAGYKALHRHCCLRGGVPTPSSCCSGNQPRNGAKRSGAKVLQPPGECARGRGATAQPTRGFGRDFLLQLTPPSVRQGGCGQPLGLLVFSCLEGDGENPALENIFLWKTKGRTIYTIYYRVTLASTPGSHHCELTSQSCLHLIQVTSRMNGKPP